MAGRSAEMKFSFTIFASSRGTDWRFKGPATSDTQVVASYGRTAPINFGVKLKGKRRKKIKEENACSLTARSNLTTLLLAEKS